ncbi:hypothetical protein VB711_02430 [Cronbergia sp. UHCC 0137]|uniref:hypothetical protein n=1 Tax=Cronbergia sp. UHCC 0137 TaxID=3110239 RepID=UPI002B20FD42|nr:hypothetical protein [Cronbergia sp. UHCC 0137]MEA5616699.1 hypothetical protein [Cronbergia sp. UHCC 0137]
MKFRTSILENIIYGELLYVLEDYAFNFLPPSKSGITSVVIDTLQIVIDEYGRVVEVFGYCPYFDWKCDDIAPPNYLQGCLFVELDNIIPGVSERLAEYGEWRVSFNSTTGWVCVGETNYSPAAIAVEFVSSILAVVEGDSLKAIWLHPESLPKDLLCK